MAHKRAAQLILKCTSASPIRIAATAPRTKLVYLPTLSVPHIRHLCATRTRFAEAKPTSSAAEAVVTPQAKPLPDQLTDPAKHAAFLGEADSDDGFETFKDTHGNPQPPLDAEHSAFHGEADSDDGFEAKKLVDGEKLEPVDATNASYLGEADSDDGFVAHRDAHPKDGDHKLSDPEVSGLHGQPGELDQPVEKNR